MSTKAAVDHPEFDFLLGFFPLLMRPDQVAVALNCSVDHVANLREDGTLRAIDISRSTDRPQDGSRKLPTWRFYKSSVREFLISRPKNDDL